MKIPARYSNLLFGGMLSIIMVTIISGTVVLINQGFNAGIFRTLVQGIHYGLAYRFSHRAGGRTVRAARGGQNYSLISVSSSPPSPQK